MKHRDTERETKRKRNLWIRNINGKRDRFGRQFHSHGIMHLLGQSLFQRHPELKESVHVLAAQTHTQKVFLQAGVEIPTGGKVVHTLWKLQNHSGCKNNKVWKNQLHEILRSNGDAAIITSFLIAGITDWSAFTIFRARLTHTTNYGLNCSVSE